MRRLHPGWSYGTERSRPISSSRIAPARLLRPGRFCGTMRSACAARNLSYFSLVYTPRKVKDGKEIIRTIGAPSDLQGAQSLCRIASSTSPTFPNPRPPSCAAPVAAAFRPPSSLSLSGLCSAGLSPGLWRAPSALPSHLKLRTKNLEPFPRGREARHLAPLRPPSAGSPSPAKPSSTNSSKNPPAESPSPCRVALMASWRTACQLPTR